MTRMVQVVANTPSIQKLLGSNPSCN